MNAHTRDYFDGQLEGVLSRLPASVRALLDKVPLHVEDQPSHETMEELGVTSEELLCGLYTGIPLTERSVEHSGSLPDVVTIYRKGILHLAVRRNGAVRRDEQISEKELQRQIRITVLHELGHHHGLSEQDLTDLGYG